MGKLFYDLTAGGGMGAAWTFEQVGELTFPQIACLSHEGNPPAYPTRKFSTMEEAEEYRRRFR